MVLNSFLEASWLKPNSLTSLFSEGQDLSVYLTIEIIKFSSYLLPFLLLCFSCRTPGNEGLVIGF